MTRDELVAILIAAVPLMSVGAAITWVFMSGAAK